jgi:hypothetical protein
MRRGGIYTRVLKRWLNKTRSLALAAWRFKTGLCLYLFCTHVHLFVSVPSRTSFVYTKHRDTNRFSLKPYIQWLSLSPSSAGVYKHQAAVLNKTMLYWSKLYTARSLEHWRSTTRKLTQTRLHVSTLMGTWIRMITWRVFRVWGLGSGGIGAAYDDVEGICCIYTHHTHLLHIYTPHPFVAYTRTTHTFVACLYVYTHV